MLQAYGAKVHIYLPSVEKSGKIHREFFKRPRTQRNNPNQIEILSFMGKTALQSDYLHRKLSG